MFFVLRRSFSIRSGHENVINTLADSSLIVLNHTYIYTFAKFQPMQTPARLYKHNVKGKKKTFFIPIGDDFTAEPVIVACLLNQSSD